MIPWCLKCWLLYWHFTNQLLTVFETLAKNVTRPENKLLWWGSIKGISSILWASPWYIKHLLATSVQLRQTEAKVACYNPVTTDVEYCELPYRSGISLKQASSINTIINYSPNYCYPTWIIFLQLPNEANIRCTCKNYQILNTSQANLNKYPIKSLIIYIFFSKVEFFHSQTCNSSYQNSNTVLWNKTFQHGHSHIPITYNSSNMHSSSRTLISVLNSNIKNKIFGHQIWMEVIQKRYGC